MYSMNTIHILRCNNYRAKIKLNQRTLVLIYEYRNLMPRVEFIQ